MHKFGVVLFAVIALAMTFATPLAAKPMLGWPEGDNGSAVGQAVIQVVLNVVTGAPAWLGVNLGWPDEDDVNSPPPPGTKPPEPKVIPTTVGGIKWNYGGGR